MDANLIYHAKRQSEVCRAVANSRRLIILWMLTKEELSVNEIARRVGSSLQNISQHLRLLKKTGIVGARRSGQTIYYHIVDQEFLRECPALLGAPERTQINQFTKQIKKEQ